MSVTTVIDSKISRMRATDYFATRIYHLTVSEGETFSKKGTKDIDIDECKDIIEMFTNQR